MRERFIDPWFLFFNKIRVYKRFLWHILVSIIMGFVMEGFDFLFIVISSTKKQ